MCPVVLIVRAVSFLYLLKKTPFPYLWWRVVASQNTKTWEKFTVRYFNGAASRILIALNVFFAEMREKNSSKYHGTCFRNFSTPACRCQSVCFELCKKFLSMIGKFSTIADVVTTKSTKWKTSIGRKATSDVSKTYCLKKTPQRLSYHSQELLVRTRNVLPENETLTQIWLRRKPTALL